MKRPQAVFFDLDGTIVDTERVAVETIAEYFAAAGAPISAEDMDFIVGKKWEYGAEYLLARYPLSKTAREAEEEIIDQYRLKLRTRIENIAGAPEFVRSLHGDYRLACVSGSHLKDIRFALERFKILDCFESLVGCEDYKASKPSPEAYLTALARFNLTPGDVVVFEDSHAGLSAAVGAGLRVIQVGTELRIPRQPLLIKQIRDYHDSELKKMFAFS